MRLRMPFGRQRKEFPSHLWTQCPTCGEMLFNKQLARNKMVCTKCEHHFRLGARERIELLADKGSFTEHDVDLTSGDPLGFSDQKPYPLRIAQSQTKSGEKDAAICGTARIDDNPVELAVMDFEFMGGSMGSVVGEKFARACDHAAADSLPLISVSSSGGARMQEGILALMQLPKTVCALEEFHDAGGVMISVLAHPTTGGLLASFASLGDVLLAEPGALMSFAGPRVVAQTTREKLPDDFGLAESNLRFGHIDRIVPRPELRPVLAQLIRLFDGKP